MLQTQNHSLSRNYIQYDENTSWQPFFKAIARVQSKKPNNENNGTKTMNEPRVLSLLQQREFDNKLYYEFEVCGNSESSYRVRIIIENERDTYIGCNCPDFNYKKRVCKHGLAAVLYLQEALHMITI